MSVSDDKFKYQYCFKVVGEPSAAPAKGTFAAITAADVQSFFIVHLVWFLMVHQHASSPHSQLKRRNQAVRHSPAKHIAWRAAAASARGACAFGPE